MVGRGRPVVEIVDSNNCIYSPLVSLYLTIKEEFSHNTLMRVAYELRFFLVWLNNNSINLVDRVKSGEFLNDREVARFAEDSKRRAGSEHYLTIPARPTEKYLSNVMHQLVRRETTVAPGVTNGRLRRAADYISFIHRELNRHVLPDCFAINLSRNLSLLETAHRREQYRGQSSIEHVEGKTISNEIMDKLFSIIHVNHPDNPFSESVRARNAIVVKLLVDTGIRRGALAKLKISDISFHGRVRKILIRRSRWDETDPRKNKPEHKTQDHFCYPSNETTLELKRYIEEYRPLVPGSECHEFVFVAEKNSRGTKGEPISVDTINYIFSRLSAVLGTRIYPHILRHCWNERFSDLGKESGLSPVEVDKYRKLLMGWSPTSEMPERYNKIRDVEKSQEIARLHQRDMMSGFKDEK